MNILWSTLFAGTSASPPATEPSPPAPPTQVTVVCAFDDKYATPASAERSTWARTVLAGTTHPRDLTQHGGGGPLGAEWNTACDLFVRVEGPPKSPTPQLASPTGLQIPLVPDPDHPGVWSAWLEVPHWQALRRPPSATDTTWLGRAIPPELQSAVQVVDLTVRVGTTAHSARFLWAGGE